MFNALLLQPISSYDRVRINSVVLEKEVCRLEISGSQMLLSRGPERYSNLVIAILVISCCSMGQCFQCVAQAHFSVSLIFTTFR